ncbi:MAG: ABC transporter permease [Rhodospirillaceae bacterium]|nr:ABC transporter permease [Rhodospirillaceae bacterium]
MLSGLDPTRQSPLKRTRIVFHKEVIDHTRDKRSLLLALVYPLLGPLLLAVLMHVSAQALDTRAVERLAGTGSGVALTIPASGLYFVPGLREYLEAAGLRFVPAPVDAEEAVREARADVVLRIGPPEAPDGQPVVTIIHDPRRITSSTPANALHNGIASFADAQVAAQLAEQGIDLASLSPVVLRSLSVGDEASLALLFYNMIPPLAVFMIFLGAVYLAIDTTAGERERGSLEPLLTAPARRSELLLGKSLAAVLFTAVTVAINLSAFRSLLGIVVWQNPELAAPPGWAVMVSMFLIALPLMLLAVSIQMAIATCTRTMKEAQIYLGLLPIMPALPAMALAFAPISPSPQVAVIPVLGQLVQFGRLISGDLPTPLEAVSSAIITSLFAALVFRFAIGSFQRERQFFAG